MSSTMTERQKLAPTADQLSSLDPSRFESWVQERESAAHEIGKCITEQVAQGRISPYEGGSCLSAVWGSVFGYRQFHNELAPSDIVQTLSDAVRGNSR